MADFWLDRALELFSYDSPVTAATKPSVHMMTAGMHSYSINSSNFMNPFPTAVRTENICTPMLPRLMSLLPCLKIFERFFQIMNLRV